LVTRPRELPIILNTKRLAKTELITGASHGHPLFREDNAAVCYKLEEAMRATSYAASIKPFQRTKNGRDAWLALSNQHVGNDKWEAKMKRHEQLLAAYETVERPK
jgi:hypothetical protein